jgi:hypothetical protein
VGRGDGGAVILKVIVRANGEVLLDGGRVTLHELGRAIQEGPKNSASVWYHREDAGAEPHPVAMQVMQLIVSHRLPVRLSARADFSDQITHENSTLVPLFASIREKAAQRQLVVLRPDGQLLMLPSVDAAYVPAGALAAVEGLLPSKVKRNVAVIGDTAWTLAAAHSLPAANQAIPFFGMLMGFGIIGHAVWVFDAASPAALSAGCRGADVLIVDGERLAAMPEGWHHAVVKAMRTPEILVYDRAARQLRKLDLA